MRARRDERDRLTTSKVASSRGSTVIDSVAEAPGAKLTLDQPASRFRASQPPAFGPT